MNTWSSGTGDGAGEPSNASDSSGPQFGREGRRPTVGDGYVSDFGSDGPAYEGADDRRRALMQQAKVFGSAIFSLIVGVMMIVFFVNFAGRFGGVGEASGMFKLMWLIPAAIAIGAVVNVVRAAMRLVRLYQRR